MVSQRQRLLVRPRPHDDELLSSWLIRLSLANGHRPQSLHRVLFPKTRRGWTDVDFRPDVPHDLIAQLTCIHPDDVYGLGIGGVRHLVLDDDRRHPAHFTGQRRLRYCPQCLQNSVHFRVMWRLKAVTVCDVHGVLLRDVCPHCREPLKPYLAADSGDLTLCHACGDDLTQLKSTDSAVDEHVLAHVRGVRESLESGRLPLRPFQTTTEFFEAMRVGASLILSQSSGQVDFPGNTADIAVDSAEIQSGIPLHKLDHLPMLHDVYSAAFKALSGWPHGFHSLLDEVAKDSGAGGLSTRANMILANTSSPVISDECRRWRTQCRADRVTNPDSHHIRATAVMLQSNGQPLNFRRFAAVLGIGYSTARANAEIRALVTAYSPQSRPTCFVNSRLGSHVRVRKVIAALRTEGRCATIREVAEAAGIDPDTLARSTDLRAVYESAFGAAKPGAPQRLRPEDVRAAVMSLIQDRRAASMGEVCRYLKASRSLFRRRPDLRQVYDKMILRSEEAAAA
jgi:TniQ